MEYWIEGGKTPKQSGQTRDSSQRSPPEDLQPMKKMDLGSNAKKKKKK